MTDTTPEGSSGGGAALSKTKKQEFSENVQKWVLIDDQLKKYGENTRKLREYRAALNTQIHEFIHANHLEHVSIGISDGELKLAEKREYSPLTFTYIKSCLTTMIKDQGHVERIMAYLRDNREVKQVSEIRRISK
jgi:hypothetical protein